MQLCCLFELELQLFFAVRIHAKRCLMISTVVDAETGDAVSSNASQPALSVPPFGCETDTGDKRAKILSLAHRIAVLSEGMGDDDDVDPGVEAEIAEMERIVGVLREKTGGGSESGAAGAPTVPP